MKIALIGTVAKTFLNFRADLLEDLVSKEHLVYVFCVDYDDLTRAQVRLLGGVPVSYFLSRSGANPFRDILSVLELRKKLAQLGVDVVFSYFVKPVIYGSISAKLAGVSRRVAMIEGLGYVFTSLPEKPTLRKMALKFFQVSLYRISLPFVDAVVFLNPDDPIDLLEKHRINVKRVEVLGGIGLNLSKFPFSYPSLEPIRFIFIGRFLREKGIFEFVSAARKVKALYSKVEFVLLGDVDPENPGSLTYQQLSKLQEEDLVICPGHVKDISEWLASSSVFVLPSYREGIPRSTQEAMAVGRAIITTDVPGCKETVIEGVNGFLVPRWDVDAIAEKMIFFIDNPKAITSMGTKSREMAVSLYDVKKVNLRLISIITGADVELW